MRYCSALLILILICGCSTRDLINPEDFYAPPPTLASPTQTSQILASLPPAKDVITVSVYRFQDETGQNKPAEVPQYSRAVTQGGLSILKKALLDAGSHKWFRVLERGGLEDLLQERQIIRSTRESYTTAAGEKLEPIGPLYYSGLLLEGGIVSFESNVVTGGAGARYLGIGGYEEYRSDVVTVYVRAVSVLTGEVLLSVNTEKSIFSKKVSGGIFKYVSFDEIVEAEAGFTANEPPQLAVRQAIEMAVYALIMEGSRRRIWEFADARAGEQAYREYLTRTGVPERAVSEAPAGNARLAHPPLTREPAKEPLAAQKVPLNSPVSTAAKQTAKQEAVKQAKHPAATAKKSASPPPSSLVPGGWYIQVAAVAVFGSNTEEEISRVLRSSGFPVKFQRSVVESTTYLRILVGPYRSKIQAEKDLEDVRSLTIEHGEPFLKYIS